MKSSPATPLTPAIVPLAQLTRAAAQLQMPDGSVHDVRRPNAGVYELIGGLEALTPIEQFTRLYEVVQQLVPSLDREQVRAFDLDQAKGILRLATEDIEEVRKQFPPVPGPATKRRRR